jgi:hypothetical protein
MTGIARRSLITLVGIALVLSFSAPAMARSGGQTSSSDEVTLVTPAGWFASDDGTVVAEVEADLTSDVPSGPRARIVTLKHPKKTKTKALMKKITAAETSAPELFDDPTTSTFGAADVPGSVITFSITVDGTPIVQRYVFLAPPGGTSTLVLLEAPEARWADVEQSLMFAFDVS